MSTNITKRRVNLAAFQEHDLAMIIGRSSRTTAQVGPKVTKSTGYITNSRMEKEENLFFDERTLSKEHACLWIDFHQLDKDGNPFLVLEDNGSQHGTVWGEKRIPHYAKIRIRQNEKIGFVDTMNKNYVDEGTYPGDPDEMFFTPAHSWIDASLNMCKLVLQFRLDTDVNLEGEKFYWLEVQQLDPKSLHRLDDNGVVDDAEVDTDSKFEPFEKEESVKINLDEVTTEIINEDIFNWSENETPVLNTSEELALKLTYEDSTEDMLGKVPVVDSGDLDESKSLKRKHWEEEAEEPQLHGKDMIHDVNEVVNSKNKRQKVDNTSFNIKSHIMAGVTGMTFGALITFGYLASLGEKFMQTV